MVATALIFGVTFHRGAANGDGDSKNSCHLKENKKRNLNQHET